MDKGKISDFFKVVRLDDKRTVAFNYVTQFSGEM